MTNSNHQIIGNLKSAFGNCSSEFATLGKFEKSYNFGTSSSTQLEGWLNPSYNNVQSLGASFDFYPGSKIIPCAEMYQDVSAPLLEKNNGVDYTYVWKKSSNLTISGSGNSILVKANNNCYGCTSWIECDIYTPSSCGGAQLASSVKRNFTWGISSDADLSHAIYPPTNNNGTTVGSYNNICSGGTYNIFTTLASIPLPSNVTLQWSYSGPITGYGSNSGIGFTTNSTGFATITCSIINGSGCLANVSESYIFEIVSPCSTPSENSSVIQRNINKDEINNIKIFPNPAKNLVSIEIEDIYANLPTKAVIYNYHGKALKKFLFSTKSNIIDISDVPAGIYILQISNAHGAYTEKLIKI